MKIERPPTLAPGDVIDISITHEIVIGGEKSWVKYGAQSTVRDNETTEDAEDRVAALVDAGVMKVIHRTVETVRGTGA